MATVEDFMNQIGDAAGLPLLGVKLLVCLIAGYPLGLIHRLIFIRTSASIQHIFFTIVGIGIARFCFGNDFVHSLANIIINYILLSALGGTSLSVALAFIIHMGYLLGGYYYYATDDYDIDWTTAHCVLTLKLIAVVFDRYDGAQDEAKLNEEQKWRCLKETPSLLEMLGHAYFFGGFLVGPQISMSRYLKFTSGSLLRNAPQSPFSSVLPATIRIVTGFVYMGVYSVVSSYGAPDYMLTTEFANSPEWYRLIYPYICVRTQFVRYVSAWLLAESSCMMSGISYNEKGTNFYSKWNAMANVRLRILETAYTVKHLIQSFNINTNRWGVSYIYKRLRFLGNTMLSQLALLYFLAIWHGLYIGYFVAFTIELADVFMENESVRILAILLETEKTSELPFFTRLCVNAFHCFRSFYFLGIGFAAFSLITYEKTVQAFKNIGYAPLIIFGIWTIWYIVFNAIAANKLRRQKAKELKDKTS
ncbi:Lysophospholipid acyltransferase 5 [Trichoplax sp. H2]|nr:Lysophospholipid acyltransferase 5 [Trichoplax sp. H2]|eukprot:RDD39572.1 Lysophospholipid acyltransferase 5 [Trichoplax sp. H2]